MRFENHNAWPLCRNDKEKVACMASAMQRLGDECTVENMKASLGVTSRDIEKYGDQARAKAAADSIYQTRARVPATQAA